MCTPVLSDIIIIIINKIKYILLIREQYLKCVRVDGLSQQFNLNFNIWQWSNKIAQEVGNTQT